MQVLKNDTKAKKYYLINYNTNINTAGKIAQYSQVNKLDKKLYYTVYFVLLQYMRLITCSIEQLTNISFKV